MRDTLDEDLVPSSTSMTPREADERFGPAVYRDDHVVLRVAHRTRTTEIRAHRVARGGVESLPPAYVVGENFLVL